MAGLELLISPPGRGKTSHCIEVFRNEIVSKDSGLQSHAYFVLPNQEHAHRIQSLVLKKNTIGLFNAHILTINDLACRLLGVQAGNAPTDVLRRSIVKKILLNAEFSISRGLPYFDSVKEFPGFHDLLVGMIKEFKSSLFSVEEFERRCQKLLKESYFKIKFRDFLIFVKNYEEEIKKLGLREPEENIQDLLKNSKKIPQIDLVIFDGFYHFTRSQKELIRLITKSSKKVLITLSSDLAPGRTDELFYYLERTRVFLEGLGFKRTLQFPTNYRTDQPALLHLEKNLFLKEPKIFIGQQSSIRLFQALNPVDEVDRIAREIKTLYRHSKTSLHYSDICIILRKMDRYEEVIGSVFSEMKIPVTIHERKKLIEHGIAIFLYHFFSLATRDWKKEDLFFVLKSSFLKNMTRDEDIALLESASLTENVLSGRQKWEALIQNNSKISLNAQNLIRWVISQQDSFLLCRTAKEFEDRLLNFIQSNLGHSKSLNQDASDGLMDKEAINSIKAILKSARAYFEASALRQFESLKLIGDLLESLGSALFSTKPSQKNQVQVYDVIMAIPKEYKVVFVVGLTKDEFPQKISQEPLFKDFERRLINAKDEILEERAPRSIGERYFFYMAISRAKEKLYLSYPLFSLNQNENLCSPFINETRKCFADTLPLEGVYSQLDSPINWCTQKDIFDGLAKIIFTRYPKKTAFAPSVFPLLNHYLTDNNFRSILYEGFKSKDAVLLDPGVKNYFKNMPRIFSPTKLENFSTCAFKYFANRILDLAEPLDGRQPILIGNILHKVLEEFFNKKILEIKSNPSFWDDEVKINRELWEEFEKISKNDPFKGEPLYRRSLYQKLIRGALKNFAKDEKKLFSERNILPGYFEFEFGKENGYLIISDPEGDISIQGKIDRIDILHGEKKALVVDYKLSKRTSTLRSKLDDGLELQLPIYLLAIKNILGLDPLGAELRFLRQSGSEGIYRQESCDTLALSSRKRSLDSQEFETLLTQTQSQIRQIAKKIKEADISIKPKTCDFCSYDTLCRFDQSRLVYEKINEKEF